MSWFKQALSVTIVDPSSYYTAVDPGEFYEWRYKGLIPKGTVVTKKLPPSDIFTEGLVVASIQVPPDYLEKKAFGYELSKDLATSDVKLHVGQIQAPGEIVQKYYNLQSKIKTSSTDFQNACKNREFVISTGATPHLYKIVSSSNDQVSLSNFGSIEKVFERLHEAGAEIEKKSRTKIGRAFELADYRTFANTMTYLQNKNFPIDASKLAVIVHIANLQPEHTKTISWQDCCCELSHDVNKMKELLKRYESLSWIRDGVK